jgi:hypothetical protein
MRGDWRTYLARLFGLTAGGSTAVATAVAPSFAALPDTTRAQTGDLIASSPGLIFERPNYNEGEVFAGHSSHASHASHASHSSHYSGSGGDGYSPYVAPAPAPAAPPPAVPAAPPAPSRSTTYLVMIMRLQARLHDLGYYEGTVDGVFGRSTKDALRRFQLVKGLPATSRMDDATLAALGITY